MSTITVITRTTGKVQGVIEPSSVAAKNIQKIFNIPYAEPPTGKLRSSKPVPKKQWDGKLIHDHVVFFTSVSKCSKCSLTVKCI